MIQLHLEFTVRKMNGEAFIRRAQKDFPEGFHSDEELALVINRAISSSGHLGAFYPGGELEADQWLRTLGDNTDILRDAKILEDTEDLIESWATVKARSSTSVPLTQDPVAKPPNTDVAKYSWMLGSKRIPLSFAEPPTLDLLLEREGPSTPSETVPNA
jgi:hypothetical protein